MALLTAASIASDLGDAIARQLKRGDGWKTPALTEAPLPIDLAASDASAALGECLIDWMRSIRQVDEPWPDGFYGAVPMWLVVRLSRIRHQTDAAERLVQLRTRLRRALDVVDRLPERSPAGTCSQCGAQLLAELGADTVQCACGVLTTGLRSARRERAAAADVLGTATEISGALATIGVNVTASVIRKWASRGRLGSRGKAGLYAMSDVLALCAQRDERKTHA